MKSIYRNMALCGRAMIMLLMLVLSIGAMNASAQVTGTVVDPEGEPLTGATIMVVGHICRHIGRLRWQFLQLMQSPGSRFV